MSDLIIRNGRLLIGSLWQTGLDLRVDEGRIGRIGARLAADAAEEIDAFGMFVVPGFIDVHVHGAAGAMCEDGSTESIERVSATLARFGVTGFLATLATLPPPQLRAAVAAVSAVSGREPGARILGIHLEGPYLSPLRAGAQAVSWMRLPSIGELGSLQELCGGRIRLVTVAPELEGALAFIAAARQRGIAVAIGHSNASMEEMQRGVEAGATHVTHLFNAMRELHHREPGVIGVGLTDDRLSVELICDGHHLAPHVVDLALRCKPPGKAVFVSDAVGALGMPDGDYEMFGVRCTIAAGAVRLRDGGNLAGSCLSLDQAVRNVHAWLPDLPLERLFEAVAGAPAAAIGATTKGRLTEGYDADVVLLDAQLEVAATVAGGQVVWRRG